MALTHGVTMVAKYGLYLLVPWLITAAFYRVMLHPLSKFPGPFWAKITHGYGGIYAMGQKPHIHVYQNFQKYGPVYREGPNRLVFNNLSAIRDIYSNPNITKSLAYHNFRWKMQTSLTPRTKLSTVSAEKSFEPTLIRQIDVFLRRMVQASRGSEVVDVTVPIKRLAIDVIGHLAFGCALNTLTETDYRFLPDALGGSIFFANLCYTWATFSWLLPVVTYLSRSKVKEYTDALLKLMRTRMSQPVDAKTDFYSIAKGQLSHKGDKLELSELWQEAIFFITAGGSTVGTAMAGTLFHLSRHDDWYAKVAQEVREAFKSGQDIRNGPALSNCKVLRAVIDESLRISPPSLLSLWRTSDPKVNKTFVVDGHLIPPGTEVAVNLWSIYHTAEYSPEPFSYCPDRWMTPEEGKPANPLQADGVKGIMKQANVGFGLGDRNCAGKSMAYLETSIFIAKLLWYFDFQMAPGKERRLGAGEEGNPYPWGGLKQFQLRDIIAPDQDGPNLVFTLRGGYYRDLEADL